MCVRRTYGLQRGHAAPQRFARQLIVATRHRLHARHASRARRHTVAPCMQTCMHACAGHRHLPHHLRRCRTHNTSDASQSVMPAHHAWPRAAGLGGAAASQGQASRVWPGPTAWPPSRHPVAALRASPSVAISRLTCSARLAHMSASLRACAARFPARRSSPPTRACACAAQSDISSDVHAHAWQVLDQEPACHTAGSMPALLLTHLACSHQVRLHVGYRLLQQQLWLLQRRHRAAQVRAGDAQDPCSEAGMHSYGMP